MLILVHGAEPLLSRQRVSRFIKEAEERGALVQQVDCAEDDVVEAVSNLSTASLFENERLLVFRDALAFEGWHDKELQGGLAKAGAVFAVSGRVKQTEPLHKFVSEHGTVEEYSRLSPAQLKSWLKKEAGELGAGFAPGAEDLLVASCGPDLEKLSQELRKLAAYASSPRRDIAREDIVLLVERRLEPQVFSTIDAMARKDARGAMKLLSEHLMAGERPLQLLSAFAWQFRTLLSVKDLQERGTPPSHIGAKLKLHPFVAKKSIQAAARFSFEELKELYRKLYQLDLGFKTSSANEEQLLYLFFQRAATKEKRQ